MLSFPSQSPAPSVVAMTEWAKVVTSPFGLVGFALFLVFGYLARLKKADERRWIAPTVMFLAVAALSLRCAGSRL